MKINKWSPLFYSLLFLLTVLVPAHADPINLQKLIDDNESITVDDKLFSNFASNRGALIEVEGRTFASGNAGLSFFSTPNFDSGFSGTTDISFTVTVLDPNFRISGFDQALAALPEVTGMVEISDQALTLGTGNLLGSSPISSMDGTPPILNSVAHSTLVKALRFERTVDLTGPLSGEKGLRHNMSVSQSIIPEPSTVLLFGTGIAGLGLWRWKKNRSR